MANQQLKRLLRRAPATEEAEFELLQSRVLSRLTKVTSVPSETPTETQPETPPDGMAEPERPVLAIDGAPSANGTHPVALPATNGEIPDLLPATNGEHPDALPATNGEHPEPTPVATGDLPDGRAEANGADSRIRSVKVVTYDLPATVVGVMAEPTLPDWELAALPMIVQRPPRRVTKPKRARTLTESPPATKGASKRAAVSEPPVGPIAESTVESTIEPTIEFGDEPTIELIAEPPAEMTIESSPDLISGLRAELIAEASAEQIEEFIGDYYAKVIAPASAGPRVTAATVATPPAAPAAWPAAPATRPAAPAPRRAAPAPRPDRRRAVAAPIQAPTVAPSRPATAAVPYCPYCAVRLDPPPTTSRRCARCHERIMVKRVEGRVIYLTEASVAVFDAERLRMTNAGRWNKERSRWLKAAATVDAPAQRIARLAAAPISAEVVAASEALYTTTVERGFRSARRDRRWEDASRIRREQAMVLYRFAGSPIPPPDEIVRLHREGATAQLRGIEEMTRQAELVSAGCCDACRADGGQTFKISLELRTPRLPHAGCPKGLCRCDWYLPVRDQTMVRRQLRRRARADQTLPPRGT